jgi:hypothetical protein
MPGEDRRGAGAGAPGAASAPAGPAVGAPLAEVQGQLYDLITAPEGARKRLAELGRAPRDLEAMVRSSGQLSAVERVDIYANMYFFRILEVLADEYAKIVTLVGGDVFHNLVTDYLLACRPAHPSLREVGARLPAYLAYHPLTEARPWLSELARLERTRLELFDGPDAEILTFDAVRAMPPEALPELALRAIPCQAVVRVEHVIAPLWRALEAVSDETHADEGRANEARTARIDSDAGRNEGRPQQDHHSTDPPRSVETILVWRQAFNVFHRVLDPDEVPCLSLVEAGATFATLCERLSEGRAAEAAAQRAYELLARWLSDGLLASVTTNTRRSPSE